MIRKLLAILLVSSMILVGSSVPGLLRAPMVQAANTDLALGKTCTINQGGTLSGTSAANITDGNTQTMWRSYSSSNPATLTGNVTLDLGTAQAFNKIVLTEYKQNVVNLIVKVSDDNSTWNEVYNKNLSTTTDTNRVTTIPVDNLTARYIRIIATDAIYPFGIYELEVYNVTSYSSCIVNTGLYGGTARTVNYSKENFHIYLLIGQSNMCSRAPIESKDTAAISRAYLLNGLNQWEDAVPGLVTNYSDITTIQGFNRYSSVEVKSKINGLNIGSYFAKAITKNNTGIAVGIVSNARGGTTLGQWQKGSGTNMYEEAVRRTKEAMKTGTLKGILWHQGEGDLGNVGTYMSGLSTLVNDLRTELGAPNVPFIAGQIIPGKGGAFNPLIMTIGQNISNSACVSSDGTDSIGDGTHFNTGSQRLLGQRYADKIIQMVYGGSPASNLMFEAENQTWTSSDGTSNLDAGSIAASGGRYIRITANAAADHGSFVQSIPAGTYVVKVGVIKCSIGGIMQMQISADNRGPTVDTYEASSGSAEEVSLGTITFSSTGSHTFNFEVTGKNASSGGYGVRIDYVKLVP